MMEAPTKPELYAILDKTLALLEATEWLDGAGCFLSRCNACGQPRGKGPKHKRGCRWVIIVNKARRCFDD